MKKINLKALYPHLIAIITFIIIAYLYFLPTLEGKIVHQSDISSWRGAANEIIDYREKNGEEPLWTNAMFSGMPTTMISTLYSGNYLENIYKQLFIGKAPTNFIVIAMVSFYFLLLAFGVNYWLAAIGALAFGFCSYNFQIIQVGHNAKMVAIAFMPAVLASLVYSFRKNRWLGAVLFGITLSFEIMANHPQITFYLAFITQFLKNHCSINCRCWTCRGNQREPFVADVGIREIYHARRFGINFKSKESNQGRLG